MKHFAITGASGVVGTRFREIYKDLRFTIFDGDIRNSSEVKEFCKKTASCDAFLHLAALVPKQIVDSDPSEAFDVNVRGTLNVLEGLKQLRYYAPWTFFASTSHVYSSKVEPIKENDLLFPFTTYGLTKLQAEQWCRNYSKEYGLKICIGRIFSFSDVLQDENYFLPAMVKKIIHAQPNEVLKINGVNGKRDFLRVPQLCTIIYKLHQYSYAGEINIGTGYGNNLIDIIRQIAKLLNRADLTIHAVQDEPNYLIANIEQLNQLSIATENQIDQLLYELTKNKK